MKAAKTALPYRADIDGLRAVAVLAVVAFHAGLPGFRGGFTGVDVFFVLSGYLISGIIIRGLEKGTFTLRDFYARRVNRIFPALIVVLLGTFALGWYLLFRSEFLSLGKHIAAGATFLSNAALVQETGYFDVAAERKPLLHLWSLAIEEQFYLFWPLLLFLSWRYKPRFVVPALTIGISSYVLALVTAYTDNSATGFYLPFTRLWELVAGFALFVSESPDGARTDHRRANAKGFVGIAMILASILFVNSATDWPGPWTLVPVVGTALLISARRESWVNRKLLAHPAMVGIGLISYPLYLWHWPLLAFVRFVQPNETSLGLLVGAVVLSLVLATLTYRLIEFPIRARVTGRGRRSLILVALLAMIGVLGGVAGRGNIPLRLDSPRIRSIQEALVDWNYPGGGFDKVGNLRTNVIPGNPADTVLFAGDSHMEQYWPRVDSIVRAAQGRLPTAVFLTERACPTFPGVGRKGVATCGLLYSTALRLARSPGIGTVVLTSYWDDFFRRELLFSLNDPKKTPISFENPATDSLFADFERGIASLVKSGKKVFVVLTIPIGLHDEFDPRAWLPDRLNPRRELMVAPTVNKAAYLAQSSPVVRRVQEAAERAGAVVLDPIDYLCSGSTCPKLDSAGNPLYLDARHLRSSVARKRAVWMDSTLK